MFELCFKVVGQVRWALVAENLRKYQSVDSLKYRVTKNGVVQFEGSNVQAGRFFAMMTANRW